jgi:hypothetical protein
LTPMVAWGKINPKPRRQVIIRVLIGSSLIFCLI